MKFHELDALTQCKIAQFLSGHEPGHYNMSGFLRVGIEKLPSRMSLVLYFRDGGRETFYLERDE